MITDSPNLSNNVKWNSSSHHPEITNKFSNYNDPELNKQILFFFKISAIFDE